MGVDFSLGANMLTMGPFAELYEKNPDAYYSHLIRNQIAFQFGFLGAYVYFIGSVVRAYFTLDLTSLTFVDGAIRMIVASILALVLSFAFDFALPDELILTPAASDARGDDSIRSSIRYRTFIRPLRLQLLALTRIAREIRSAIPMGQIQQFLQA